MCRRFETFCPIFTGGFLWKLKCCETSAHKIQTLGNHPKEIIQHADTRRKFEIKTYYLRHVCLSAWNNSAPAGQIFIKPDIWVFFRKLSRKLKFHSVVISTNGTLHAARSTFVVPYMQTDVHLWYLTCRPMYIYGTLHADLCTFMVPYMQTDVHLWYLTCRPMYIYGTLHADRCAFMVPYMQTDVHLWYLTCRPMYIYGTLHADRCTFMVPYMQTDVHLW